MPLATPTQEYFDSIRDPEVIHLNFSDNFGEHVFFDTTYRHVPTYTGDVRVTNADFIEGDSSAFFPVNNINSINCNGDESRTDDFIFEGDFCIEFYFKFTSTSPSATLFQNRGEISTQSNDRFDKFSLVNSNGRIRLTNTGSFTDDRLTSNSILPNGNWNKIKLERINSTVTITLNDISTVVVQNNTDTWGMGRVIVGQNLVNAYIDRFVITNKFNPQLGRWSTAGATWADTSENGRLLYQVNIGGLPRSLIDRPKSKGKWFYACEIVNISQNAIYPISIGVLKSTDQFPQHTGVDTFAPNPPPFGTFYTSFRSSFFSYGGSALSSNINPNYGIVVYPTNEITGTTPSATKAYGKAPKLTIGLIIGIGYDAATGNVIGYVYDTESGNWRNWGIMYTYIPNSKVIPCVIFGQSNPVHNNTLRIRSDLGTPIGYSMWV